MPRIDAKIRSLIREHDHIALSDVARALDPDGHWRALLPAVREAAAKLADRREVTVTQKRKPVDARTTKGPLSIARAVKDPYKAWKAERSE